MDMLKPNSKIPKLLVHSSLALWAFLLMCAVKAVFPLSALASDEKHIIGWVEKVQLLARNITVHAKIDTGADNSSLNVEKITEFVRQGEPWVRFSFTTKSGRAVTMERKVHRYAEIKRKAAKSQERPVILLGLCLGSVYKHDMEVNLADRKNFTYNMLIGRSFLRDTFLVDSSLQYTVEPSCAEAQSIE